MMALALVGGAVLKVGGVVLEVAVGELLKAVTDAKEKATNFQQPLTRLESTLTSMIPRVNEIIWLNHMLKVSDEEMKELITILQNGQELVNKSSNISFFNFFRKGQYSKELLELDYSLLRYFQTNLPLDHYRVTKEMQLMMRELHMGLVGAKDEGESSKPKEDEYSEIQSSHEPCEGESSMPKGDEFSEIQSSHEPDEGELSMTKGGDGFLFRSYKGCIFNFDLKNIYSGCVRYCEFNRKHGKVMVKLLRPPSVNETSPQTRIKSVRETILKSVESHPNIVPSIGCHLHKFDVLLFYDYFNRVSLYTRLHEYRGSFESSYEYRVKCPYFKWESRLKISLGVARGISHLHSLKFIHGNLHSSNVLLTSDLDDGCIFDYALLNITSATQASDVHSFGLILLEMLSGKHPTEEDLPRWFHERSALKVFDSQLFLHDKNQNEAQNMMHIALQCVEEEPGKRPKMDHVVEMIQNIRPSH